MSGAAQTKLQYIQSSVSDSGSETLLNFPSIQYAQLAYALSFVQASVQNLSKNYLFLAALSGDTGHGDAEYFVTSLALPPPNTRNSNIRRVQFNLRWTNAGVDGFELVPSLGNQAPSFVLANVSSGQYIHVGFRPKDLFATDQITSPIGANPFGAVKQGCLPFFAKTTDNVELIIISPSNVGPMGTLNLSLSNFDYPVWEDVSTYGWQSSS